MEQENQTPQPQEQQNADQPAAAAPAEQAPEGAAQAEQKPAESQKPMEVPGFLQKKPGQPPVTGEEKLWAIVCYVPFFAIMALIVKPDSKFIKLHGRQGLLLSVMLFVAIFLYLLPFIGSVIGGLIHLGVFLVGLFSMYQSAIGNWWKIPVLGDLSEMIPADLFSKTAREAIMGAESTIGKEPGAPEAEQPAEAPAEEPVKEPEAPEAEQAAETPAEEPAKEPETPAEQPAEAPAAEAPTEQPPAAPAQEPPKEPEAPAENKQPETEQPPTGGEEKA